MKIACLRSPIKIRVAALAVVLSCSACGPPRVEEAARIINYMANSLDLTGTTFTIPTSFSCAGHKYTSGTSGSITFTGTKSASAKTATVAINAKVNVQGDSIFFDAKHDPSLNCVVNVKYAYDPDANKLVGPGTVTNCDAYVCLVGPDSLSCEDFTAALAANGC